MGASTNSAGTETRKECDRALNKMSDGGWWMADVGDTHSPTSAIHNPTSNVPLHGSMLAN